MPKYTLTGRTNERKSRKDRDSGIELLKVFAIFLVVINHVVQTLSDTNAYVSNLTLATTDLQLLLVTMLRYSGHLGNTIFLVCSAWFLLDSKRSNKRKVLQILADVWVVSVTIFIVVFIERGGQLDKLMIFKQFFPTSFSNNWYITCYITFCFLYPFLNAIIAHLDQKTLLRVCMMLLTLYFVLSYFFGGLFVGGSLFNSSNLVIFVAVYFVIAYLKHYLPDIMESPCANRMLLIIGIGGHCFMILFTNLLGLNIGYFSNKLLRWNVNYNPFCLMIAIALFNFARNAHFRSKLINHISGLSYLIYIIHENLLLRAYYRPLMWQYIYETYGYRDLLFWILVLTIVIFVFAFCCALLYEQTVQRLVARFCDYAYPRIAQIWYQIENRLLRFH